MTDEPLPATERTEAEPSPTDREASERDGPPNCDGADRDAPDREGRAEPERATDPPPGGSDGGARCDWDRDPAGESGETDDPERTEYRLERLRLWRTVVTLAVVVARLIRSL